MIEHVICETERLRLRRWHDEDKTPFARMNADPTVMNYFGPPLSRSASDAAVNDQLLLMMANEPAFWAVERLDDGQFMGCIGIKRVNFKAAFTPTYEIGWRLARSFWGHGYATEGAKAALNIGFLRWDLSTIHSFTVPANKGSQSVMEKIGMQRVPGGDFRHPKLSGDDPLSEHVLYKWQA